MVADEAVRIDVTLEDLKAEQGLKSLEKTSKRTFRSFEQDSERGDRAAQRLNKTFGRLRSTVVGLMAGFGAVQLARKSIANFQAQEKAVVSLEAALIASGQAYGGAREEMEQYAAALQRVTIHGDEAILQQMAYAVSMGASTAQAQKLVQAATDLSVAQNMPFEAAARQLGQAGGGQARELGMKIPEIRELSRQQLLTWKHLDVVLEKYGGMATKLAESEAGRFTQILNKLNDDLENVGGLLVVGLGKIAGFLSGAIDVIAGRSNEGHDIGGVRIKGGIGEALAGKFKPGDIREPKRPIDVGDAIDPAAVAEHGRKYKENLEANSAYRRDLEELTRALGVLNLNLTGDIGRQTASNLVLGLTPDRIKEISGIQQGMLSRPQRYQSEVDKLGEAIQHMTEIANALAGTPEAPTSEAAMGYYGKRRKEIYEGIYPPQEKERNAIVNDLSTGLSGGVTTSIENALRAGFRGSSAKEVLAGFAADLQATLVDSVVSAMMNALQKVMEEQLYEQLAEALIGSADAGATP